MAKRPTKWLLEMHAGSVRHIKGAPAKLAGIIDDAPDEKTAIARAIEEFKVPTNERERLMARCRD